MNTKEYLLAKEEYERKCRARLIEYYPPVETVSKCIHCDCNLGCQNDGELCGICKVIEQDLKKQYDYGRW